jgi:integrase
VRAVAHKLGTSTPDATAGQLLALAAGSDWSRDYRRSVRTALRSFYRWRMEQGFADENPADVLPVVPESRPRPRPAPDAVMARALAAGMREHLMARLGAEVGLRRAEIARVRADDLIDDVGGWSLIVNGKGSRQRTVPIGDGLAAAIRSYREPGGRNTGGWLFGGQCDGHISPGHVGVLLSRAMGAGWSAHKLRHRYASRGYAGTGDLVAVQRNLGHSSLATTQRYVATTDLAARAVSAAAAA